MEARLRKCWARKRPAFAGRPLFQKLDQNTLRSRECLAFTPTPTGHLKKGSTAANFFFRVLFLLQTQNHYSFL